MWQVQYPEPLEGFAARGVVAGPRWLCVAGAVPRAARTVCGARCRRWAPAGLLPQVGPNWGEPSVAWGFGFFLRIFVFISIFVRLLAFLLACWANITPSRANIAPRWLNLAPKMGQHSPKTGQGSPKMGQGSPKMGQHSPKMDQHGLNMGAKTLRIHGFFHNFCVSSFFGPTSGQDWTTYV